MGSLYIVRHGETEWNAEGKMQGQTDIALSDKGRDQARAVAHRLRDCTFDAAYSSDLRRTRETAEVILGDSRASLQAIPLLREYRKGVFEGLTVHERARQLPDEHRASLVNDLDFAPSGGGESTRECNARLAKFAEILLERHMDDRVLVVGHGGSLRCLLVALMDLPLEANWKFVMHNCALSVVYTYPDNAVLHLYNDTGHLNAGYPNVSTAGTA